MNAATFPGETLKRMHYGPDEHVILAGRSERTPARLLIRGELVITPHGVGVVVRASIRQGVLVDVVVANAN